jgi:hypothetical protein
MRRAHEGQRERENHEQDCRDPARNGEENCAVDQVCPLFEAWKVGFELQRNRAFPLQAIEQSRPVKDAFQPVDQDGDEANDRAEQECWRRRLIDDPRQVIYGRQLCKHGVPTSVRRIATSQPHHTVTRHGL